MTFIITFSILYGMPSATERRLIQWFAGAYNSCNDPKIVELKADDKQEAPDAICRLADDKVVALELTSFGPPKGTCDRRMPNRHSDFSPLITTLGKKLRNDYHVPKADEVWLLVHLRYTLARNLVEEMIYGLLVPPRFDRIFFEWPLPGKTNRTSINVLDLPEYRFWTPDLPRPNRFENRLCFAGN